MTTVHDSDTCPCFIAGDKEWEAAMARFIVSNQHLAEDCPQLSKELVSYYDAGEGEGAIGVYCTCSIGEHRMHFITHAGGPTEALAAIPPEFLRTSTTVSRVEPAYDFASRGA
ncbi:MAG: hypothetical protein ACE5MI_09960 [Acidimicrobiia bacterium]